MQKMKLTFSRSKCKACLILEFSNQMANLHSHLGGVNTKEAQPGRGVFPEEVVLCENEERACQGGGDSTRGVVTTLKSSGE